MTVKDLQHSHDISLRYRGDCALMGVTPAGDIYAEELYDETWLAQYHITQSGDIAKSADEQSGQQALHPIELPPVAITPQSAPLNHPLNFRGLRQRGLRAEDRVSEWLQPLPIMQKMPLIERLGLNIPPPLLLGIAESIVTSQTALTDELHLVCRRLRLAHALPQPTTDANGLPYDYDTVTLHIAHTFAPQTSAAPALEECLGKFGGVALMRPLDCLHVNNRLIIADASSGKQNSRILVWVSHPRRPQ